MLFHRAICYERLSEWNLAEKDLLLSLDIIKLSSPQCIKLFSIQLVGENEIYILIRATRNAKKSIRKLDPTKSIYHWTV